MGSRLDSNFGVWLVTVWLQTLLQGCGYLQAFLYFHWYPKDRWGIKSLVLLLLAIETFQIVMFFQIIYFYLIDNFGDFENLLIIYWQNSAQLFATYLSAFVVQVYFGYCIYVLDKKRIILPIIILVLALTQIGAGITQTILVVKIRSFAKLQTTEPVTTLEAASALACDLVITGSLLARLGKHKSGIKSTNSVLNRLMVNAVNRGILTALCAAVNMIVFIAKPGTFYFILGLLLSGKLYMNSMLATLNSRKHIVTKAQNSTDELSGVQHSIAMEGIRGRSRNVEEGGLHIIVNHESTVQRDIDLESSDMKKTRFMEGMA